MEISQSKYSNIEKNNIKMLISKCSINNCNKIYDMLILENIKMTKNNNGYFLNLSNMTDITIDKIKNFLNYLIKNKDNKIKEDIPLDNIQPNIIISNIENDYNNYKIGTINSDKINTEAINDTDIEDINDIIENDKYIDDDNDNESNKTYFKKNELSPYLSKIMKKCKDIQRNNETDFSDYIDDYEDSETFFDWTNELNLDLTYTI